ncbi:MAG: hypothetical protein NTV34_03470 [Proteobacteria bacterium]|nr:hypothetical protein [Pseudomonadota bacterium]
MAHVAVPVVDCPKLVRDYCDGFKELLSIKGAYQNFVALISAAVFRVANISDIARYFLFASCTPYLAVFSSWRVIRKLLSCKRSRRHTIRKTSILSQRNLVGFVKCISGKLVRLKRYDFYWKVLWVKFIFII